MLLSPIPGIKIAVHQSPELIYSQFTFSKIANSRFTRNKTGHSIITKILYVPTISTIVSPADAFISLFIGLHMWATSPPKGVARKIVFIRSVCLCVCLSVCLCVWPIFWYFISRLLEEISIWNLYRILIGLYSMHWKKCHRDCTLLFEGTVLSQKLSHRKRILYSMKQ